MATPQTFTDLDIMNQAITAWMGGDPIQNLQTEQNKRAIVMRANYEAVSESCQTKTAWRFNSDKAALNKLTAVPENRWSAAWQLPADMLKVLGTWPPGRYEIQGSKLYSNNTSQQEVDYQRKRTEDAWPTWFQRYAVIRLAIRTVKGITGEDPSQAMLDELAAAEDEALFQDAQQQPNQEKVPAPFVDVRQ